MQLELMHLAHLPVELPTAPWQQMVLGGRLAALPRRLALTEMV
jgi:hypothetical protein